MKVSLLTRLLSKSRFNILLLLISNIANHKFATISTKIKLCYNLTLESDTEKYTKEFCTQNRSSVKGYYQTLSDLKEIIAQQLHKISILGPVNPSNLMTVIDSVDANTSINQVLIQLDHNYISDNTKQLQKRGIRRFYYEP